MGSWGGGFGGIWGDLGPVRGFLFLFFLKGGSPMVYLGGSEMRIFAFLL